MRIVVPDAGPYFGSGYPKLNQHHPLGGLHLDGLGLQEYRMRQSGTVKFFNQTKGFGFITPDQGGKDVFVHITAVERSGIGSLDEGMRVSFETEPDKRGKGPKAVELQPAT
jgi:cold shock protein